MSYKDISLKKIVRACLLMLSLGFASVTWGQNYDFATSLSETGKKATRLADEVYVSAQDLTLLQVFYTPRVPLREKRVNERISAAMKNLEGLAKNTQLSAESGSLPRAEAMFVDSEVAAAQSVIFVQSSALSIRDEQAKYPLENGPHLRLLNWLFGKLPGSQGTPEFYLQLLTWARDGFPSIPLEKRFDPAFTPREVLYLLKRKRLEDPSGHASFYEKPAPVPGRDAVELKNKKILKNLNDRSKSCTVKGGM